MRIPKLKFTRLWTDPDAFPTVETDEIVVRADMQALHNETQDYLNRTLGPTLESVGTLLDDTISGLASQSTARKLGFSPTDGVNKTNIQAAIENVQSQIAGVALNTVPNGSIDTAQLANESVTQKKIHKMEPLTLLWEEKTSDTMGYISVTSWPFVRTGHLMAIKWYGEDRTFTRGDGVNVKGATGDIVAKIDIPDAGTNLYFNLKSTATYLILCTEDNEGYEYPPRFTFFDLPTWSDSPEGTLD